MSLLLLYACVVDHAAAEFQPGRCLLQVTHSLHERRFRPGNGGDTSEEELELANPAGVSAKESVSANTPASAKARPANVSDKEKVSAKESTEVSPANVSDRERVSTKEPTEGKASPPNVSDKESVPTNDSKVAKAGAANARASANESTAAKANETAAAEANSSSAEEANKTAESNRSLSKPERVPDGSLSEEPVEETVPVEDSPRRWHPWVVLGVMMIMLIFLFHETFPPWCVLLCALAVVWNVRVITTTDAIKGFSNPALVTVGALFVVVRGVDRAGLIAQMAKLALGKDSSQQVALVRFCLLVYVVGGFINNTPLVALLMPILRDWARSRDFAPSKFLLPMAYSSVAGGNLCTMGASTHLMINGMLEESSGETFGLFAPAALGVFSSVFALWYLFTLGVQMLPDHQGGLFRTLKERTHDMVTELQVMPDCPLVGTGIWEALDRLSIPRAALVKVYRAGPKQIVNISRQIQVMQARETLEAHAGMMTKSPASTPGELSYEVRPVLQSEGSMPDEPGEKSLYGERTRQAWGTMPRSTTKRRHRAFTDSAAVEKVQRTFKQPGWEIFPVPEHEVLEGGDVLFLSLPQQDCLALVGSQHVAALLRSLGATVETSEDAPQEAVRDITKSLRICELDLLEVPGRESEFLELVVSRTNPFVGRCMDGPARQEFEKQFQVAILAIRHSWSHETTGDQLPSSMNRDNEDFLRAVSPDDDSSDHDLRLRRKRAERQQPLGPGDALLVLARADDCRRFTRRHEFMATTAVAHGPEEKLGFYDYIPMLLFIVALVLVSMQKVSMTQATVALMVLYFVGGWVEPAEVRDCVDWNLLILIGSALGLATAVQVSGLSSKVADLVRRSDLGRHGTVFVLFFFTMLLAELVTNSAAAALGFPLALDLSNALELKSAKPLAMTVMLASATAYASPISSPATLIVMGPGGYRFLDFLKVGLPLDIIYWISVCLFLPVFFPLV